MYFPISEVHLSLEVILLAGFLGGFVSGFLGIGCGIIITPLLVDLGIPTFTAVATQLCHAIGTNFTSFLSYKKKRDVDYHLAWYILIGGLFGAILEYIFLKNIKDQQVALNKFNYIYISVLSIFGFIMLKQSFEAWKKSNKKQVIKSIIIRRWMFYFPAHKIFLRSRTEISIIIPIFIGALTGMLVASLGGGNNLLIAPIITYLIGRISPVVNGTTALAGFIITAVVTVIYASNNYLCDIYIVFILFTGASVGSWLGVRLTYKFRRYYIYAISAIVVFVMAGKQIYKVLCVPNIIPTYKNSDILDIITNNKILYTFFSIISIMFYANICNNLLNIIIKKIKKIIY